MRRIGLMGGSFDPVHEGHLNLARAALASGEVDHVVFLPTGNPPHKPDMATCKLDRLRMVELAVGEEQGMSVSREEIDRGGVIYTIDTLNNLEKRMPDSRFVYLIGADTLRALETWRRIDEVIHHCDFLVMMREGETRKDVQRLAEGWAARGAQIRFLTAPRMDVSSTQIRHLVEEGRPIGGLVPEAVAAYIASRGLYRDRLGKNQAEAGDTKRSIPF